MTEDNAIDRLLKMDPLLDAEKITGKSYKEDDSTASLGMIMQVAKASQVQDEMLIRDDTFYNMTFDYALNIIADLGFEEVYTQSKPDNRYSQDRLPVVYKIFWRGGVLLSIESYSWETKEELKVNKLDFFGNWIPDSAKTSQWSPVSGSGGFRRRTPGFDGEIEGDPWMLVMRWDGRTALRHNLARIEAEGTFQDHWVSAQGLYLHSFVEEPVRDPSNYDASWLSESTDAKITLLPTKLRAMIQAAQENDDL